MDDMNTAAMNYVGGHGHKHDEFDPPCPVDKLVLTYCDGVEPSQLYRLHLCPKTRILRAINEENMQAAYLAVLCSLAVRRSRLRAKYSLIADDKAVLAGQKYYYGDAIRQLEAAIRTLKALSGLCGHGTVENFRSHEIIQAASAKKDERSQQRALELEKGIEPQEKPRRAPRELQLKEKTKDDDAEPKKRKAKEPEETTKLYKGWEYFPKLCLKIALENPYLFDAVKCDTLRWEFRQKDKSKEYAKEKYLGAWASIMALTVRCGQTDPETEPATLWLAGLLGPNDIEGLLELHSKADRNLQDKKVKEIASGTAGQDGENGDNSRAAASGGSDQPDEGDQEGGQTESAMHEGGGQDQKASGAGAASQTAQGDRSQTGDADQDGAGEDGGDGSQDGEKVVHKILVPGVSLAYGSLEEATAALRDEDKLPSLYGEI